MDELMALTTASLLITNAAFGQELPRLDEAVTWYNQAAVRNFAPVFDFDSDGCYPATPFDKNNNFLEYIKIYI